MSEPELVERCRRHVLGRIAETAAGTEPFRHVCIERIFPPAFYAAVRAHMLAFKHGDRVQDRMQDNPAFVNQRYNLFASTDEVATCIRDVFSSPDVMLALLEKFYAGPLPDLAGSLSIHHEFEYVFTKAGRYQNIHIDIPPKFMSFVFYIPEHVPAPEEAARNGTVLYDATLVPHYPARFTANSACIFVPHFASYHGFSSTIDRDALVLFYVNQGALRDWQELRRQRPEAPPFDDLLDAIERKLRSHPLKEFAASEMTLRERRSACLVNAPQGRVLVSTGHVPPGG